jgi:transposase
MQAKSLKLEGLKQGVIPIVNHFLERVELRKILLEVISHKRYVDVILVLLKNILVDHLALYAIEEWAAEYDPNLLANSNISDDVIARALDRLFEADRATLQTQIVLKIIKAFKVDTSQIHNDSTTVKVCGKYKNQRSRGIKLNRGYSKDHRPDLKQLLFSLTVSADGAIPIHFKAYDGNQTDDTTHWEIWNTLRSLFRSPDFLYVADSKLCVEETLLKIDREHGQFVTILPRTREEVKDFANAIYQSEVRWKGLWRKRYNRKKQEYDIFDIAIEQYQTHEGFVLYWYRSSKKKKRDQEDRNDRIAIALDHLSRLSNRKRRGPKTVKPLAKSVEKILSKYGVAKWINVEIEIMEIKKYKQTKKGKPQKDTAYRQIVKKVPRLIVKKNLDGINRSKVMDGIFPLITNTQLSALDVLKKYKYQPYVEKRHSLFKSLLEAAPIWLKRNDRIEALMFVEFLAQMTAALIEREIRQNMIANKIPCIPSLPENRNSKTPTMAQIIRLFENRTVHRLYNGRLLVKSFCNPLTPIQKQVLDLAGLSPKSYLV